MNSLDRFQGKRLVDTFLVLDERSDMFVDRGGYSCCCHFVGSLAEMRRGGYSCCYFVVHCPLAQYNKAFASAGGGV